MPRRNYPQKKRSSSRPPRRLSVRAQLRAEPDVRKYARAVIALAMAQAEHNAAAQRQHEEQREQGAADHGQSQAPERADG